MGIVLVYVLGYELLPDRMRQDLVLYPLMLGAMPFIFIATKNSAVDAHLGELSYPTYLLHLLIIEAPAIFPTFAGPRVFSVILWSLALSAALNWLVQRPLERRFKRPS
jgi:peptidoglycan/LPS O-acetylase OafA/YrhL